MCLQQRLTVQSTQLSDALRYALVFSMQSQIFDQEYV